MNTRAHYKINKIILLIILSCPDSKTASAMTLLWLTDKLHFVTMAEHTDQK